MTDLGRLGGTASFGQGVNDRGQVVGYSYLAGDASFNAFLYSAGTLYDLNSLLEPGFATTLNYAYGINNNGQIVANGNNGHAYLLNPIAAPVPEPETYAMMMLGMAMVGVVTRRRRLSERL
jgi:probable HAF family extracellular repeat protein